MKMRTSVSGPKPDVSLTPTNFRLSGQSRRDADMLARRLLTDFVAEVGDDRCVATGANFFK